VSGYGYLDGHRDRVRSPSRFLVFGLAVIVSIGALSARLFYLQVVNGGQFAAQAQTNRTALEAIPSTRGLIYDRSGAVLVTNVPTFAVKVRPADLPEDRRDEVVTRLSALTGVPMVDINKAIDGNPGSRFDAVRVAQDVPKETASLIAEASFELPGVEVAVEARRQYAQGPLLSQILGYTGPVSADQIEGLKGDGG
jgi:penicillin-binding protein 2